MEINLKNKIFGRWKVLSFSKTDKNGTRFWLCKCKCGTIRDVRYQALIKKMSQSCGCLHKELASKANKTHGETKTRLCQIWYGIRKRIFNPNDCEYHNYGGRGIKLCKEWQEFIPFKKWALNNGYKDNLSIERKDFNGNYCPKNCSWIPMREQGLNRRGLVMYKRENQKHAGMRLGGSPTLVRDRIKRLGWSKKKAYNTSVIL
jgi:hypothetical protein